MENINNELFKGLCEKGGDIFIKPKKLYSYNAIINGCMVKSPSGATEKMSAVGTNTWRGFHKINKEGTGSKEIFLPYFNKNKSTIIDRLKNTNTAEELNELENKISEDLREMLKTCIKGNMLVSYNKVRKPVDLYIEHIVSMSEEFSSTERAKLIPHLFLPLDSQIFACEQIFSLKELNNFDLQRSSTFQDVHNKRVYTEMQHTLLIKSQKIGLNFYRIYFDLFWNGRFMKSGANLFEANLG